MVGAPCLYVGVCESPCETLTHLSELGGDRGESVQRLCTVRVDHDAPVVLVAVTVEVLGRRVDQIRLAFGAGKLRVPTGVLLAARLPARLAWHQQHPPRKVRQTFTVRVSEAVVTMYYTHPSL